MDHLQNQLSREQARLRTLITYKHGVRIFTWLGWVLMAGAVIAFTGPASPRLALALAAAGIMGWVTGFFFAPLVAHYQKETEDQIETVDARLNQLKQE